MKNKKVMTLLAVLFLSLSLSACSSGENDVFPESDTTMNEEIETEKEEKKEESEGIEETETTKESESQKEKETESAEKSKEQEKETETKESKTSQSAKESTPKQQEETKPVETTPPPHTHNYSSSITAATCVNNGVKTYVCSCGDSYNESILATGHNFITQYEEVFHESKGEMQQVQVGTSDRYVECARCGATFSTDADFDNHRASFVGSDNAHAVAHCYVHSGEPIYELQYVVIQPEWTEQVPYNVCATCGARQ